MKATRDAVSLVHLVAGAKVRWGWRIRLPPGGGAAYCFGYVQAGAPAFSTLH